MNVLQNSNDVAHEEDSEDHDYEVKTQNFTLRSSMCYCIGSLSKFKPQELL
jgi:hypothetical protein